MGRVPFWREGVHHSQPGEQEPASVVGLWRYVPAELSKQCTSQSSWTVFGLSLVDVYRTTCECWAYNYLYLRSSAVLFPPSPLLSATGSSSTNAVLAFDFVCVSVDKSRRGHRLPCRLEDLSHFD